MELAGNRDALQLKLPLRVAYTNTPDLPNATLRVPLIEQVAPSLAHFL